MFRICIRNPGKIGKFHKVVVHQYQETVGPGSHADECLKERGPISADTDNADTLASQPDLVPTGNPRLPVIGFIVPVGTTIPRFTKRVNL